MRTGILSLWRLSSFGGSFVHTCAGRDTVVWSLLIVHVCKYRASTAKIEGFVISLCVVISVSFLGIFK